MFFSSPHYLDPNIAFLGRSHIQNNVDTKHMDIALFYIVEYFQAPSTDRTLQVQIKLPLNPKIKGNFFTRSISI